MRPVDEDTVARAYADPATNNHDLLVLEALAGWSAGPLTLDSLARRFASLDRRAVSDAVARLEEWGWLRPGTVSRSGAYAARR